MEVEPQPRRGPLAWALLAVGGIALAIGLIAFAIGWRHAVEDGRAREGSNKPAYAFRPHRSVGALDAAALGGTSAGLFLIAVGLSRGSRSELRARPRVELRVVLSFALPTGVLLAAAWFLPREGSGPELAYDDDYVAEIAEILDYEEPPPEEDEPPEDAGRSTYKMVVVQQELDEKQLRRARALEAAKTAGILGRTYFQSTPPPLLCNDSLETVVLRERGFVSMTSGYRDPYEELAVYCTDPRYRPPSYQLTMGRAQRQPDVDMATVRRYLKRNQRKLAWCYEQALTATPSLAGGLELDFAIAANGLVAEPAAHGPSPSIEECARQVIRDIEFPRPKAGHLVTVTAWPYELRPWPP